VRSQQQKEKQKEKVAGAFSSGLLFSIFLFPADAEG
jgi:hypothetical protein